MNQKELFDYYHHTNKEYIEIIGAHRQLPERIRVLMSHILNAQAIWIDRIMEEDQARFTVWQLHSDPLLLAIQNSLISATDYIFKEIDLEKEIFYFNSKGKKFQNRVKDILFHIINHGTHHRAQIAMLLSQQNIIPPTNDYIFWKREEIH